MTKQPVRHFFSAFLLALTGCTVTQESAFIAVTHYECAGTALTVRWARDVAVVSSGGQTYRLPRARSGSGARYADSAREIWEHRGELRWTDKGAAAVVCRAREKF